MFQIFKKLYLKCILRDKIHLHLLLYFVFFGLSSVTRSFFFFFAFDNLIPTIGERLVIYYNMTPIIQFSSYDIYYMSYV